MSAYLQSADYAAYGILDATDAQVQSASLMVDAELGRPEGLLWLPDAAGNPGYMAGLTPSRSYIIPGAISPGTMVTVAIPGASFGPQHVGGVAILDRATLCGPAIIAAASGETLTLESVLYAHAAGATLEFGLVISEQAKVYRGTTIRVSRPPLARLLSVYGRQSGWQRPSLSGAGYDELAWLPGLSSSQSWGGFPLAQCDYDAAAGNIHLYPGTVNAHYSDARINYVAGWDYASLPSGIKQAVAALVSSQAALLAEGFSANIKVLKSGDGTIERFAGAGGGASLFDSTTLALIAPYRIYRI